MIGRLLLACRGEIAHRFIRTARRLGVETAVVHDESERHAPFVIAADHRVESESANPYASIDDLLSVAERVGADAVAPGYGPLAESADFAAACRDAGLVFVGPPEAAIRSTGDKIRAREAAERAGIPVVPGGVATDFDAAIALAEKIGYPLLIKAALGGGGRGIRLVESRDGLEGAWTETRQEAAAAFGRSDLYIERFLGSRIRHVEVQVLGDRHGHIVALGDRGCSVQRRRQKVVEEAPAPALSSSVRESLHRAATTFAEAVGYASAGTVEFLVDEAGAFYFIEMNARIQVEHPVTEAVTGVDLVEEMLRVASGEPLRIARHALRENGHAIEFRVCAENPLLEFMPSGGLVTAYRVPEGPGVRVDSGIGAGSVQSTRYDSLCLKVTVWGQSREDALGRSAVALRELLIAGFPTNTPFHLWLLRQPAFRTGAYDLSLAASFAPSALPLADIERDMAIAVALSEQLASAEQSSRMRDDRLSPWRLVNERRELYGS